MQKEENSPPFEVFERGDLVEVQSPGLHDNRHRGIVTDLIHYGDHQGRHPDEYSCKILLLGSQDKVIEVRAKWIKMVSKSRKEV
jgi:hypothetical protein